MTALDVHMTARPILTTARATQKRHSEPGPPSSQSTSEVKHWQLLGGTCRFCAGCSSGGRGGGDGMETRGPKSMKSVPKAHVANLEPGPPLPPAFR